MGILNTHKHVIFKYVILKINPVVLIFYLKITPLTRMNFQIIKSNREWLLKKSRQKKKKPSNQKTTNS